MTKNNSNWSTQPLTFQLSNQKQEKIENQNDLTKDIVTLKDNKNETKNLSENVHSNFSNTHLISLGKLVL